MTVANAVRGKNVELPCSFHDDYESAAIGVPRSAYLAFCHNTEHFPITAVILSSMSPSHLTHAFGTSKWLVEFARA